MAWGVAAGGMHMGPDDPLFAGRHGPGMGSGIVSLPPGSRYDPIGPPGMPVRMQLFSDGSSELLRCCECNALAIAVSADSDGHMLLWSRPWHIKI